MAERDLMVKNKVSENDLIPGSVVPNQSEAVVVEYYIEKLPREFRRGLLTRFDKIFLLILLISSIFIISGILYLEKNYSIEVTEKKIARIQRQFASLLLNKNYSETGISKNVLGSTYESDVRAIKGLKNYVENFKLDINDYFAPFNPSDLALSPAKSENSNLPFSRETLAGMREDYSVQLRARKSELSRKIESVGLLNLLSSRSGSMDQEYVEDLLKYANLNNGQLQTVLSKLDGLKVPHAGDGFYRQRLQLRQSGNYKNQVKGDRKTADQEVENLIRNMKPLQQAESEAVARNTSFEKLTSASMASVGERKLKRRRTAKMVMATIRSHMRSLQDCYKNELKKNPSLKGRITIRFTVTPKGHVISAQIINSSFKNPRLESCLLGKIKRWKDFPQCDQSVGNQTFRQTFKFGM